MRSELFETVPYHARNSPAGAPITIAELPATKLAYNSFTGVTHFKFN